MIITQRLTLLPLNYEQLIKYTRCDGSLELELKLNPSCRIITDELKDALEQVILPNAADKKNNYLFSTIWVAISKTENIMVGDFCWYGEPNEAGEIEVGYGIHEGFQNKGYMTEIVCGAIQWAKSQQNVNTVKASTTKINIASFKVLEKNGFIKTEETDELFHWRLKL